MSIKSKNRRKELTRTLNRLEDNVDTLKKLALDILKDENINEEEMENTLSLINKTEELMKSTNHKYGNYFELYSVYEELTELFYEYKNKEEEPIG